MSDAGSISGATGDVITVTCDSGYSGSASATCQANGVFTSVTCTPSEFYCLGGAGGRCYPASTSCFPNGDCHNMGNWNAANGYANTYESFQTFCSSWSANTPNFNGGVGSCAYKKLAGGGSCADNAGIGSWEECKKAATSLGLAWETGDAYSNEAYSWTPLGCWFWDGAIQLDPETGAPTPNELGFDIRPNDDTSYNSICVCGHAGTPCPT